MRRRLGLAFFLLLLLVACGRGSEMVAFSDLIAHPERYAGQQVTVLGYYYQDAAQRLLVVGIRTDDGFQNPVPLGDPIWVEGMPEQVANQLGFASGSTYGLVQVKGQFETGGGFGPEGDIPSRLVITDPATTLALEAVHMQQDWVPAELQISGTVALADLLARPDQYSGKTITVVAFYYWTPPSPTDPDQVPRTSVLAEGIRSLDGVQNAIPIGKQVWVDGMALNVRASLNVLGDKAHPSNVHGLVRVNGRFDTRGGYGANKSYPYRIVARSAEAIPR